MEAADESTTCRRATRRIDAPSARIFELLTNPSAHHTFDASTMVGATSTPDRLSAPGQVFTMEMTYEDDDGATHYRTDNHVTQLVEGSCVAWRVAPSGGELLGWEWRYDLEPLGDDSTDVTLTYDWTGTPPENIDRYGVPAFSSDDLGRSLSMLDDVVRE